MLVPLLSFFDPAEFDAFMRAYIHERGDDGWDVLNYLKVDDRTGWLRRYELGDYQGAVERILKQYQNVEEPAFPGSARTLLAMSYSRLGDSAKAVQVYEDALVVFPDDATVVHFNLGSHYQRTGDAARATEQFREVVRRERENSTMPELLAAALQRLSNGLP